MPESAEKAPVESTKKPVKSAKKEKAVAAPAKVEVKALSPSERSRLRRLGEQGKIQHKWGYQWDVEEARTVLANHPVKVRVAKSKD